MNTKFALRMLALVTICASAHAKPVGYADGVAIEPEWAKGPWPTEARPLLDFSEKASDLMWTHWYGAMAKASGVTDATLAGCNATKPNGNWSGARMARFLSAQAFVVQNAPAAVANTAKSADPKALAEGVHWIELSHHMWESSDSERAFATFRAYYPAMHADSLFQVFSGRYLAALRLPCVDWQAEEHIGAPGTSEVPRGDPGTIEVVEQPFTAGDDERLRRGLKAVTMVTSICHDGQCRRLAGYRPDQFERVLHPEYSEVWSQVPKSATAARDALAAATDARIQMDPALGFVANHSLAWVALHRAMSEARAPGAQLCLQGTCASTRELAKASAPNEKDWDKSAFAAWLPDLAQRVWVQSCVASGACPAAPRVTSFDERRLQFRTQVWPKVKVSKNEVAARMAGVADEAVRAMGPSPQRRCLHKALFWGVPDHPIAACKPDALFLRLGAATVEQRSKIIEGCSAGGGMPTELSWRCQPELPGQFLGLTGWMSPYEVAFVSNLNSRRDRDVLDATEHAVTDKRGISARDGTQLKNVCAEVWTPRERSTSAPRDYWPALACMQNATRWCVTNASCTKGLKSYWKSQAGRQDNRFDVTIGEKTYTNPAELRVLCTQSQDAERVTESLKVAQWVALMRGIRSNDPRVQEALASLRDEQLSSALWDLGN